MAKGGKGATPHDSAQEWVAHRVRNVADGMLLRGDGVPIAVVRVEPTAMALLSERERGIRVQGLHEALQGISGAWQMSSVQRPVDLDQYLDHLADVVRDADTPSRRAMARGYLAYVRSLVGSGQATEQRHYVLLGPDAKESKAWKETDARKAAADLEAALARASLAARQATAAEIRDLLVTYLQPDRRADEAPGEPSGITVWGGGDDGHNGAA